MLEALHLRLLSEDMDKAVLALSYIDGLIDYKKDLRSNMPEFD